MSTDADALVAAPSERLTERTNQILDQIREVFADQGFEGASMQLLARAAGMSAGNFYRYFPSKDAIIEAMIERDLQMLEDDFDRVRHSPDPREIFRQIVTQRVQSADCDGPMLIEIESAALRRPEIDRALRRVDAAIEKNLLELFVRLTNWPVEQAATQFTAHAQLIVLMVKGLMRAARRAQSKPDQLHLQALGRLVLDSVDNVIDQVVCLAAGMSREL